MVSGMETSTPASSTTPRRRLMAILAALAVVCGIGLAFLLPKLVDSVDREPPLSPQDAAAASLRGSPEKIADILQTHAREALGKVVENKTPRFVALDESLKPLDAANLEKVASAYVLYGDEGDHAWRLFVGMSDGPPSDVCGSPNHPSALSCQSTKAADGGVVTTSVIVLRKAPEFGDDKFAVVEDVSSLTNADLPTLRVERNVRYTRANRAMTSVKEIVSTPTSLDPNMIFASPASDLSRLATDPDLKWR